MSITSNLEEAQREFKKLPQFVKAQAGAVIEPMLDALLIMAIELQKLKLEITTMKGVKHGND